MATAPNKPPAQPSAQSPAPIPAHVLCAAEMLEGIQLSNGWTVMKKIVPAANSTGGNFSVPYLVEKVDGKNTKHAFMKALNWRRLAGAQDFARAVQEHITLVITHNSCMFMLDFLLCNLLRSRGLPWHAASVPHRSVYEYKHSRASWSVGPD
jgi:hypothetical protein